MPDHTADQVYLDTPVGPARLDWYPAPVHRRTIVIGHGSATGVEAADLQALAHALPAMGTTVALMTQPYRLGNDRRRAGTTSLDIAWQAVWPHVRAAAGATPVIAGGRSAGSQVACRTAGGLGAAAVLALAYPLLGPGSPAELLAVDLPTLIVQGGEDPFGGPTEFPALPAHIRLVEIPGANHMFATGRGGDEHTLTLVQAVAGWIEPHRSLL